MGSRMILMQSRGDALFTLEWWPGESEGLLNLFIWIPDTGTQHQYNGCSWSQAVDRIADTLQSWNIVGYNDDL